MRPVFTLYGRRHCHLCDEMLAALGRLRLEHTFEITVVDVDEDPALAERYGADVPVLVREDVEVCRHRLQAQRFLASFGGG